MSRAFTIVAAFVFGLMAHAIGAFGCNANTVPDIETAAGKATPVVFGACGLAEEATPIIDPAASGAVDLVCNSAEAVDQAAAQLAPRGVAVQVVSKTTVTHASDGGVATQYRVRCLMHAPIRDAGGG